MKQKFSWNRNVSHHRIALTRFAVFAFVQAVAAGLLMTLSMGIASDGTREYIVTTAMAGLATAIIAYFGTFVLMGVMYRWVIESDMEPVEKTPPTPPRKQVMWEDKNGNWWESSRHPKVGEGENVNRG